MSDRERPRRLPNGRPTHGAHMRWEPKTQAEKEIFAAIVKRHASGGEALIRFGPGQTPKTASPK